MYVIGTQGTDGMEHVSLGECGYGLACLLYFSFVVSPSAFASVITTLVYSSRLVSSRRSTRVSLSLNSTISSLLLSLAFSSQLVRALCMAVSAASSLLSPFGVLSLL